MMRGRKENNPSPGNKPKPDDGHPTSKTARLNFFVLHPATLFYVFCQLDGATRQPVQKITFDGLLRFVAKQQGLAREVFPATRQALSFLPVH